jgi:hypothetical protein
MCLGVSASSVSQLSHSDRRYQTYRDAYLYRLFVHNLSAKEKVIFLTHYNEPKIKDLALFFNVSKQNFYTIKKSNENLFGIYVDAWKYKNDILNKIIND